MALPFQWHIKEDRAGGKQQIGDHCNISDKTCKSRNQDSDFGNGKEQVDTGIKLQNDICSHL